MRQLQIGKTYECEIVDLTHAGEGVGRVDGMALFVAGALPGDRVLVEVIEVRKSFARGNRVELLQSSDRRVEPDCSVADQCGGCQLRSLSYDAQLEWKRNQVIQALRRIGGFAEVTVNPTIGMLSPGGYRNKSQFHSGEAGTLGFYAQGTNELIQMPLEGCALQQEPQNKVVDRLSEIFRSLGIRVKGVLVRSSRLTGEVMVVVVTLGAQLSRKDELVDEIRKQLTEVVSVYQNINPKAHGPFLGRKNLLLWGEPTLLDQVGGFKFQISPHSFFQVNSVQTEVLYTKALEFAGLAGGETVFDLYCGIGTITLMLAQKAQKVYGIEEVPQAVEDARFNAELNQVGNVEFMAGQVEKVLPKLIGSGARPDVVVLDPPRAGAAPEVIDAIAATGVERVVYVSCNPATLARDLKRLAGQGYEIGEVQPVDMFPHTSHVECVVKAGKNG